MATTRQTQGESRRGPEPLTAQSQIIGRAKYNGREYLLIWEDMEITITAAPDREDACVWPQGSGPAAAEQEEK